MGVRDRDDPIYRHASLQFLPEDIQFLRQDWSVDQCLDFLDRWERAISRAMVRAGRDKVIEILDYEEYMP